jgi:hypothetical protein
MCQFWVGTQHGVHECTERALVLPYVHFGFFKLDKLLADNGRGRNWVAGGHSMTIQYCLNVLFLGKGDSAHISVTDDLHVEYPARFSEVCGRENGGNLFFEEHDNVDELAE